MFFELKEKEESKVLNKMKRRYISITGDSDPESQVHRWPHSVGYICNDVLSLYLFSYLEFLSPFTRRPKQTISVDLESRWIKGLTENSAEQFINNVKKVEAHWRKKGFKTKSVLTRSYNLPSIRLTISTRDNFKEGKAPKILE